jgi:phosphoglycerate dehydrogenase-like enzyme
VSGDVVVTFAAFDLASESAEILRAAGLTPRHAPLMGRRPPGELTRLMRGAVAGVVSTDEFDRAFFQSCPTLRALARVGVGVDTIDLAAATKAGVVVTTTPGANTISVAEHAIALLLAVTRCIPAGDKCVRDGAWARRRDLIGPDLSGSTIGIVGGGVIGRAVAKRLAAFDVDLLVADVIPVDVEGATQVPFDSLLERSDVVTLHVPLHDSTRQLIGERELALMRPGAILINTARGGIVDEAALARALRSGHLRGAGIDVFSVEPPEDSPLLPLANVVVSPHVAGLSSDSIDAMLRAAATAVVAVLAGRTPAGVVNPDALDRGSR